MDTIETIFRRHSYRGKYKAVPVPREDLVTIMKAGLAAPSACNTQTASLIAVDDPAVLQRLHSVIRPDVAPTAPAAICVVTHRVNAYRDRCFAVQDYSAAVENILLAAVALGYQSCWYEGHITDEDRINEKMAEILGVPREYELVCFLPLGVGGEEPVQVQKKPFHERAFFNSFGESEPEQIPPKSITQILLDELGTYFSLADQYGENRMPKISRKLKYAIEISRGLHLDTDLTAAILFAEELARIDDGIVVTGILKEDPAFEERIHQARLTMAGILEQSDAGTAAQILECLDRLADRREESAEEKLAYILSDAAEYADSLEAETDRHAWLADFKNRVIAASREEGGLSSPQVPVSENTRRKVL